MAKMMASVCLLVVFLLGLVQAQNPITAIASFSGTIEGSISFVENEGSATKVAVKLKIPKNGKEQYEYFINSLPVNKFSGSCEYTGSLFDPLKVYDGTCPKKCATGELSSKNGKLVPNDLILTLNYEDAQIFLSGKDSIIGRSIIIQKTTGEKISCATIYQQSFDQTSDLRADLIEGKIKGYISFQQIKGKETSIFASLSGLNDYVGPFFFHIHNFQITNGDCASTGGHYDPLHVNLGDGKYKCNPNDLTTCEIGDITGKFGSITPENDGTASVFFVDPSLDIMNQHRIEGLSVVIHDNHGARITCGNLQIVSASATYNGINGINGRVQFTKVDGGKSTKIEVSLTGLTTKGNYYLAIHKTGVIAEGRCPTQDLFDPYFAKNFDSYACDRKDASTCQVGDFKGKFGTFASKGDPEEILNFFFTDTSLSIENLISRSVVIYASDNSQISCASILSKNQNYYQAISSFSTNNLDGKVTFSQISGEKTTIWIRIKGLPKQQPINLEIHDIPVNNDDFCNQVQISSVFDPHQEHNIPDYKCDPKDLSSCKEGDLSAKFGPITSSDEKFLDLYFIDPHINLMGVHSIFGRSLVIHSNDLISCSVITPLYPHSVPLFEAIAIFDGKINGHIIFQQYGLDGDVFYSVKLTPSDNNKNLNDLEYFIHDHPIDPSGDCSSSGSTFNPFGVNPETVCEQHSTQDCIIGDLSAKFGKLTKNQNGDFMFFQTDPVLQLNGEHSISELSILLSSNGNTIACANIGSPKLFSDWKFKNGIQGSIELTHLFGSGARVDVELNSINPKETYLYEIISSSKTEAETWDPFNTNSDGIYSCHSHHEEACAVGDLSGKKGPLVNDQETKKAYMSLNDHNLPLFNVIDKYIRIRDSKGVIGVSQIKPIFESQTDSSFPYVKTAGFGALITLITLCICGICCYAVFLCKKRRKKKSGKNALMFQNLDDKLSDEEIDL